MTKLELYNSWKSAMRGLILLGDQIKLVKKWNEFSMTLSKEDKKKIKTSVKFIKYISKKAGRKQWL